MQLDAEVNGSTLLVSVGDSRIDAAIAVEFKERMRELTIGHAGRVLLDLANVGFLDSSGLGAIVGSMKQLNGDTKLELAGLSRTVEKVFKLTRMDTVFTIHSSAAVALAKGEDVA